MTMFDFYNRYRDRIPSWLWLVILLAGLLVVIAIPIAFIYLISHFEGVASAIFLVIGWFVFGRFAKAERNNSLVLAGAVLFFALMGMAIDQPGNYLYNRPFALSCPEGSTYERSVSTLHPVPGRTDFTQRFQCFSNRGSVVYTVPMGMVIAVRFAEYVLIAYLLLGVRMLMVKLKRVSPPAKPESSS